MVPVGLKPSASAWASSVTRRMKPRRRGSGRPARSGAPLLLRRASFGQGSSKNPREALVDGPQALLLDELPRFLEDVALCRETYEKRRRIWGS